MKQKFFKPVQQITCDTSKLVKFGIAGQYQEEAAILLDFNPDEYYEEFDDNGNNIVVDNSTKLTAIMQDDKGNLFACLYDEEMNIDICQYIKEIEELSHEDFKLLAKEQKGWFVEKITEISESGSAFRIKYFIDINGEGRHHPKSIEISGQTLGEFSSYLFN